MTKIRKFFVENTVHGQWVVWLIECTLLSDYNTGCFL